MSEHTIAITLDANSGLACPQARLPELWIGDMVRNMTEPANLPSKVEFSASTTSVHDQR